MDGLVAQDAVIGTSPKRSAWAARPAGPRRARPKPAADGFVSYHTFCFVSFSYLRLGDETPTIGCMSDADVAAATQLDRGRCSFPGCTRPVKVTSATGRPSRYCEQSDGDGPVHNRGSAHKARLALRGSAVVHDEADTVATPVSMARATLDQRLIELPGRFEEMRSFLGDLARAMAEAGDIEAAGAEVEDAHRDALTKITEADRRAATAERAARVDAARAEQAEQDRAEADILAEESAAELAQLREDTQRTIADIQAQADAAVAHAEQKLTDTVVEHEARLAERDAVVAQAQRDIAAAREQAAAAVAAQQAADADAARERAVVAQLRAEIDGARRNAEEARQQSEVALEAANRATQEAAAEAATMRVDLATTRAEAAAATRAAEQDRAALERLREETRTDRDALRQAHAEQVAQVQRSADERVATLNDALTIASAAAETLRAQLATTSPPPVKRSAQRKSAPPAAGAPAAEK